MIEVVGGVANGAVLDLDNYVVHTIEGVDFIELIFLDEIRTPDGRKCMKLVRKTALYCVSPPEGRLIHFHDLCDEAGWG